MNFWQTIPMADPHHTIKGATWVKVIAHIRNNETGEVRKWTTNEVLHDGCDHPSVFNWEENNYSCDCNRRIFFGYAAGIAYEDMPEVECSEGGFSVNLENPMTGDIYYQEFT